MSRKLLLLGLVLIVVAAIITGYFIVRKKSISISNPIGCIPVDAALILQINDFSSFGEELFVKNNIFKDLESLKPFDKLSDEVLWIDSLAKGNTILSEILLNSIIYMSGHYIGGKKVDYLFVQVSKTEVAPKNVIDVLEKITGQDIQSSVRKYEGKSIYIVKRTNSGEPANLYLSFVDGNTYISKSVILVENAIRQLSLSTSLLNDTEFVSISSTTGKNKNANLFIDLRKFTSYLSTIASNSFSAKLKNTKNFGGWAELDLNTNKNQIMLNGFVAANKNENSFLGIMDSNEPVGFSIDMVLPSTVSAFITLGAKDMALMQEKFKQYLSATGKFSARDNRLKEIDSRYDLRLDEIFTSLIDNELTFAQSGYDQASNNNPASYVILKCKSGSQAERTLNSVTEKLSQARGLSLDKLKASYSIDSDTKFPIVQLPVDDVTGLLFGSLFSIPGENYYTFLGNYLIISGSRDALGHFLYSNVLSRTLSTNAAYKKFSNNIDQESYFLFYTNLSRSAGVFRKYLNRHIIEAWEENYDKLQKIQSLGVQLTEVSNMTYYNLLLQYIDDAKGKPQTIWESLLDTSFTFKPLLVENHNTKQKEIFLQDESKTIYLINKAGRILWKQTIAEAINSDVFQIDYYKNGKLQLLFSTDNYLHLIDRNGNYVERYPIRLRERATAGMALFDYEKNRDYRIMIPCADKQVYAYSKEGNILSGWQFKGSENIITQPLNHFKIGDKDYIVFADNYKTYILDRRGNTRVAVNHFFAHSTNNNLFLDNNGSTEKSFLYTTDTVGSVYKIGFDGSIRTLTINKYSADHFFDLKDVDADGQKDFIILDGTSLSAFKQDKTEIINYTFNNNIESRPIYFRFSYSDRKIGISDPADGKIYLLDNTGDLYKGFPLEGRTLFSIGYLEGKEGEFNLIVGGRNNFLYNYSVQ